MAEREDLVKKVVLSTKDGDIQRSLFGVRVRCLSSLTHGMFGTKRGCAVFARVLPHVKGLCAYLNV